MRVRLVHTLACWLLGAVGVSVLAMGSVTAWNLRQGFGAYLEARDAERLDSFAQVVAAQWQAYGPPAAGAGLPDPHFALPTLLFLLAQREGIVPSGPLPPPGPPRPGAPPRPGGADGFGERVALLDNQGRVLAGPALQPGTRPFVERPVRVAGQLVARVQMRIAAGMPDSYETRFLRSQYLGIGTVSGLLVLGAMAAAWWLARQWARPLAAVQDATARIARGEVGVRLPPGRRDEIGDVVRNVNLMAASLQRIEGARRRWIADISHELRTPLAALRGEIEALVDGVRPLTGAAVQSLREDALRLGALVDDLHLLALADLDGLPCRWAAADAISLVQGEVDRLQRRAAQAGLQLALSVNLASGALPAIPVVWDAARIGQLLTNLLENSLRYTDAPGHIEVALRHTIGQVHLTVADSAPGVTAADLPLLFEPLYRADAARSRDRGHGSSGSGLGLAICQAIVQAHGGRISAQAATLGGLRIDIDLPRYPPTRPPLAAHKASAWRGDTR